MNSIVRNMTTGLNFLIESKRNLDARRGMSRSLFEASMNFLLEADPPGDDSASGDGTDPKTDAAIEKMMPKAVSKTVDAFKGFQSIEGMPAQSKGVFADIAKKLAGHASDPDTPEAIKDFKTAEELHAALVMTIDKTAAQAQAYLKAGADDNEVSSKLAGDFEKVKKNAIGQAQKKIEDQISKLPFLQKIAAKFSGDDIFKRFKELTPNWSAPFDELKTLASGNGGPDTYKTFFQIAKDPKFATQRSVQGQVVSEPPKDLPSGTEGGQAAENQEGEEGPQFDNNQKKLIDKVSERKDDLRKLYDYYAKTGEIDKSIPPIARKVLDQFTDDPKETYSNLQNNLGPKASKILDLWMKFAGEKFEDLDAELAEMEESGEASAKGSEKDLKTVTDVFNRMKDLRKAIDQRVADEEITEKEGNTLQVLLDKLEKIGKEGDLSGFINDLSPKSKQLVDDNILGDAKEGWTRLDTDLRAIKKSAPKAKVDFGVSLDDLEKLVRDFLDAPSSKSMKAVQDEFTQGLLDAGSDEDKYTAAFEKLEKLGGSLENSKGLRLIGLDKLASEREGEAGQEEESASAGKSLSSILFNSDSSVKKKLDPGGEKIKSSLANLNTALADYTSNKGGKKNKTALVTAIKGVQDSLKGVKLEGASTKENVIVERWQKLAGLL